MDIMTLLDKLEEILTNAKKIPLGSKALLDPEDIFEIIDQIRENFPSEIKEARWIVKEKQEHLAEAEKEAQKIISDAREKAKKAASETEIVKEAERQVQEILQNAKEKEREIRLSAEDYADEMLANLEANLGKMLAAVQRGRERLQSKMSPRD